MEFRGEDEAVGFNADQAVRGVIGCAAVSVGLVALFAGLIGAGLYRAFAG